jgi:hypothetical protein
VDKQTLSRISDHNGAIGPVDEWPGASLSGKTKVLKNLLSKR